MPPSVYSVLITLGSTPWGRMKTRTGPDGAMSSSKQRAGSTRRVCPHRSYLPRTGASGAGLHGLTRLRMNSHNHRLRLRRSQKRRHSQSLTRPLRPWRTHSCESHLHRTRRPRAHARNKPQRRSRCKKRTTGRCIAANAIYRCIRIHRRSGSTYFYTHCDILPALGYSRRRCQSGPRRVGSGSVAPETVDSATFHVSDTTRFCISDQNYPWLGTRRKEGKNR